MSHDREKIKQESARQEMPGGLDHKIASDMIPRYLSDDLTEKELLQFLAHVRNCHECYEELETEYMVDRTVRYLDNDLDDDLEGSYDLPALMERDIKTKISVVHARRVRRRFFNVIVFVCIVFFALMLLDFFGIIYVTRLI